MAILLVLKGQCHETDIFIEGFNILSSTFRVCADGFQGLSKACLLKPSSEFPFLWLVDVL